MWLLNSIISRDKYNSANIQQMFWNLATTLLRGDSLFTWECIPRWWVKRDAWLAIISLNTSDKYAHQPTWTQQWVWPSAPKYDYNSILAMEFMRKKQGVLRNTGFRQVPWKFSLGDMCCGNSDMHSFPQLFESAQFELAWDSRRLSLLVSIAFCRNYCSCAMYSRQKASRRK